MEVVTLITKRQPITVAEPLVEPFAGIEHTIRLRDRSEAGNRITALFRGGDRFKNRCEVRMVIPELDNFIHFEIALA